MTTPISVAIVNYNTREHLRACLRSLLSEGAAEVVVVDNASDDGSAEMVQAEFPHVVLYANRTNSGYGAGLNQALAVCTAPYALLLNSDTQLRPGALWALSTYLDQCPQAAVVGPRLVNSDGTLQPSCYHFPTPLHVLLEETRLGQLAGHIPMLRERYLRAWRHSHARLVPWVLGAALAVRRAALAEVGGFDERFFMYFEEVDLCFRLAAAGWQVHFAPVTTVVHAGGASTSQRRAELGAQLFASMMRFYHRHYTQTQQAELVVILRSVVLARLVRDTIRLRVEREACERQRIVENVAAWKHVLAGFGEQRRQVAHG